MTTISLKYAIAVLLLGLMAARLLAADDVIGPTKIPFYTGNLNVFKFMTKYGTFKESDIPASDWASPERIAQLKRIGVFADCDYQAWALAEPQEGLWDFSLYIRSAQLLKQAGFGYIPFCWVHYPPKWFLESPEFVPYECAEHGQKLMQLSPWSPSVWKTYRRFYSAQKNAMGGFVTWMRVATPSDYGEIGYPAGMTSWLVPQKHAHPGYWCGDPYARQDFRDQMKLKFKTLKVLNARWGKNYTRWEDVGYPNLDASAGAKTARESGKVTDRRRWLDFIDWYQGFWLRFTPQLVNVIRDYYPKTPLIVSVGYASETAYYGNDYSRAPRMAKKIDVALQTPGNVPYYALKRVSTACHFYRCRYYTEPPADVPPDAEVARFFSDISNGVQVYFEYPLNLDRARGRLREYKQHMTGQMPVVDLAIFNASVQNRLNAKDSFPEHAYNLAEVGHERFDYDVVDETLVDDGALAKYRVLVYIDDGVTEQSALHRIAAWVRNGGTLLTCDLGSVESVEGDKTIWNSLLPGKLPSADEIRPGGKWDWAKVAKLCAKRVGKGMVIQLPLKPDNYQALTEAVARVNNYLSDFGPGLRNAPLIDGEVDGISATLLPDRILYFTWLDRPVERKLVFPPQDWAGRAKKPEKMEYDLKLEPHSIQAIMLK